jgi:hypothetical protein
MFVTAYKFAAAGTVKFAGNGARVSHPQQPGLPNERTKFHGFLVVESAAAETAALRHLQNDLGNTPWTSQPERRIYPAASHTVSLLPDESGVPLFL